MGDVRAGGPGDTEVDQRQPAVVAEQKARRIHARVDGAGLVHGLGGASLPAQRGDGLSGHLAPAACRCSAVRSSK
jgi:hypothetical protein